jgi:hypothetical protein
VCALAWQEVRGSVTSQFYVMFSIPLTRSCWRVLLRWSQDKIYKMVADIDKYEAFLPWCSSSKVLTSNEHGCTAEIGVGFPPIHETYISKVHTHARCAHLALAHVVAVSWIAGWLCVREDPWCGV